MTAIRKLKSAPAADELRANPKALAKRPRVDASAQGWGPLRALAPQLAPPRVTPLSFKSPLTNAAGRVVAPWTQPGDTVPFEFTAVVSGDPRRVRPEVWTNANRNDDPDAFAGYRMKIVRAEGAVVTWRADVPVQHIGNYRATGRFSVDGGAHWEWAHDSLGTPDIKFRPYDVAHDRLNIEKINIGNVNYDGATGRLGTLEDLMEPGSPETNGKYTLDWLQAQGKNAIEVQQPFENSLIGLSEADNAGSPYAMQSWNIRGAYSRAGRDLAGDDAAKASRASWDAFAAECERRGIKIILDIAPNHIGKDAELTDLFVRWTKRGKEIRELRKNDFSQVAINEEQLGAIRKMLQDPAIEKLMRRLVPHMFGRYSDAPHPQGAECSDQIAAGGWFEWNDVDQLNHGRARYGYKWWDVERTPENEAALGWLIRFLRYCAVDLKVG
jgi:hypothetical protein